MSKAQSNASSSWFSIKTLNILIGVSLIILGPMFSSPEFSFPVTDKLIAAGFPVIDGNAIASFSSKGWTALIIFAGLIYLWITVDILWPSLLAMVVIGLNPEYPMRDVMQQYLGHQTTFLILFVFLFIGALIRCNAVDHIANYLLTRDFLQGKPWILIFMLMLATWTGVWLSSIPTVLLMWPIVYFILKEIGCKPGDKLSTFLVGNVVAMQVVGLAGNCVRGPGFFTTSALGAFAVDNPHLGLPELNVAGWIIMGLIFSFSTMGLLLFAMRFIFKVDVEPLRNFDTEKLKNNPLPPMSTESKIILGLFLGYFLWLLLPSLAPEGSAFAKYIKAKLPIGGLILFTAVLTIRVKGKPIAKVSELAADTPWPMFFLLAATFYFSGLLTNPSSNINIILEYGVASMLQNLSYMSFFIITLLFAIFITNVANSVVMGVVLTPIIAMVATSYGFDAMPIAVLFIYTLLSAILTPAAGVPAAMLFGNAEWLPGKSALFYAITLSTIISGLIFIVGIPLARILF